jgi:hypothetical protein
MTYGTIIVMYRIPTTTRTVSLYDIRNGPIKPSERMMKRKVNIDFM